MFAEIAVVSCSSGETISEVHGCNSGVTHHVQRHLNYLEMEWKKLVNSKAVNGRNWKPSAHHCICSQHFPDGHTHLNYENISKSENGICCAR
jgi:hypothetical protein